MRIRQTASTHVFAELGVTAEYLLGGLGHRIEDAVGFEAAGEVRGAGCDGAEDHQRERHVPHPDAVGRATGDEIDENSDD
jgi:hypothetical protein